MNTDPDIFNLQSSAWDVIERDGYIIKTTESFRETFKTVTAIETSVPRLLIETMFTAEHGGIVLWSLDVSRNAFLIRDWPSHRLVGAFGFPAQLLNPYRARMFRFAAKIEGRHVVLGKSCDPDPRMIDHEGRMIGNILAVTGKAS
jgi:hypothetical protein